MVSGDRGVGAWFILIPSPSPCALGVLLVDPKLEGFAEESATVSIEIAAALSRAASRIPQPSSHTVHPATVRTEDTPTTETGDMRLAYIAMKDVIKIIIADKCCTTTVESATKE